MYMYCAELQSGGRVARYTCADELPYLTTRSEVCCYSSFSAAGSCPLGPGPGGGGVQATRHSFDQRMTSVV